MDSIDLRSDTVTWPTPQMREAMASAAVGDDNASEDPTVNRLEAMAAALMGKEAAVFLNSGTMGNLVAILAQCQRSDEIIVGQIDHSFVSEVGGAAALGGVQLHALPVETDGTLLLENIRAAVREENNIHHPRTRMIMLENTHMRRGGVPLTVDYTQSVRNLADERGLLLHVDGARIWNAAVALGCDVKELVAPAHTVTFCLSKGLCAPAGSMLCGSRELVDRARGIRKMLGGGMRQVGILAAAGIIGLEQMTKRLADDHRTARQLAEGLAQIPGLNLDTSKVQTNIMLFWLSDWVPVDASTVKAELEIRFNVKIDVRSLRSFRAVTHYWITPERVDEAVAAFGQVLESATQ